MAFEIVDLFQSLIYEIYEGSKSGHGSEKHLRAFNFLIPGTSATTSKPNRRFRQIPGGFYSEQWQPLGTAGQLAVEFLSCP